MTGSDGETYHTGISVRPNGLSRPAYPEPLDVGVDGKWWDMAPLRHDRAVPLRDARPGRLTGLYTLHADGELVYVGHSTNIGARLTYHCRHAGPWVDRIRAAWMAFDDVRDARQVERMIAGTRYWHRPAWNRTGYGHGSRAAEIIEQWFRSVDAGRSARAALREKYQANREIAFPSRDPSS